MPDYVIANEIPFSELVVYKRYKFLWGPYNILLSGLCIGNADKNGISEFNDSRYENGCIANDNGYTVSFGPFFPLNTHSIYVYKK